MRPRELHSEYYRDRWSENDLCNDFPGDEVLIDGLHAMQHHFYNNGVYLDIPVVRVMNTAHFLAAYIFATTCSGDQTEYDALADMSLGRDKQMFRVTMIVLAAMLKRTEGFKARQCRNLILDNRDPDFEEGVTLYDRFLRSAEQRFAEEDFLIDTQTQIQKLTAANEQLTEENRELKNTITTMAQKPQTIVYNYGTYNDIHDNPHSTIYATTPHDDSKKEQVDCEDNQPISEDINSKKEHAHATPIPKENDYNGVREYIAERKKYDPQFRLYWESHSLKQNCTNLTKEFGWIVDEHSLGANLNRHR